MNTPKLLSGWSLIFLHLLPGFLLLVGFLILAPSFHRAGIPVLFAVILVVLFLVIPFEWGFLLWQGKQSKGRLTLKGVIAYLEPVPTWQYFVFIPGLIVWSLLAAGALMLLFEDSLRLAILNYVPVWMDVISMEGVSSFALWVLFLARLIILGIIAPLTEELYFRGYLLPRMERLKSYSPLVHSVLFSLQHFLEPYAFISRLMAFLPVAYLVQRKRNILVSIFYHVLLNLLSAFSMLPIVLQQ
ncbi:MAG: CPBP family intramembrane glutamic endopeptidase [Chloroflexota bacterium]